MRPPTIRRGRKTEFSGGVGFKDFKPRKAVLLAHLLRIPAAPNDGSLDTFAPALTPRADTVH